MIEDTTATKALVELNRLFPEVVPQRGSARRRDYPFTVCTVGGTKLEVTVSDAGPRNWYARYSARAVRVLDGCIALGNPSESVFGALAGVHWMNFRLRRNRDGLLEASDDWPSPPTPPLDPGVR